MDDMRMLREFRADAPGPDGDRLAAGRERLRERTARSRGRRIRVGRTITVLGAVAAVTAGVIVTARFDDPEPRPRVEYGSLVEPRSDQWIYRKTVEKALPLNFVDQFDLKPRDGAGEYIIEHETWTEYGSGETYRSMFGSEDIRADRLPSSDASSPQSLRRRAMKLPEAPEALFKALRKGSAIEDHMQESGDQATYMRVVQTLIDVDLLPQRTRTSLFRSLREIPGVTIAARPVEDGLGRPALAVSTESRSYAATTNQREEKLFDPKTFAYRGSRIVYLAGGKIDGKITTKDLVVSTNTLVKTTLLDEPPEPTLPRQPDIQKPPATETGSPARGSGG